MREVLHSYEALWQTRRKIPVIQLITAQRLRFQLREVATNCQRTLHYALGRVRTHLLAVAKGGPKLQGSAGWQFVKITTVQVG